MVGGTWMGTTHPTKTFLSLAFFFVETARNPIKKKAVYSYCSSIKAPGLVGGGW